ncbi:MAG: hypothetical protein A2719_02585 [Candidatus Ryanbacteria bacterium RIFCSPHIGHO2_01_FULL_45_22]|uniref:Uncharacterized protein n=1 Tax=Candidatus Ryanbacteria bacterium RIFCSPHIGHO2_01_FULL_45_22 TaxID=1802114 RepID=A0A1G2G0J2_9BACT|nr:MAG: hypothetical protein A2719_02585 [Candidatus Ryanbacteria bacterium RIFCSPHIGHO2_01_FULL_45_22]
MTTREFEVEAYKFLASLAADPRVQTLRKADLASPDHVSYKCGSSESFEAMRRLLEGEYVSDYVHQSCIAGRRIAYFRLHSALCHALHAPFGPISFVELADQKPDGSQQDGFDHIEIYPRKSNKPYEVITYQKLVSEVLGLFPGSRVHYVGQFHRTTWDVLFENGAILRLTQGPLIEKIKREMQ